MKAERNLSEKEKDRIALESARREFVSVTSCCDCEANMCDCDGINGREEPTATDFKEEELRLQVKRKSVKKDEIFNLYV